MLAAHNGVSTSSLNSWYVLAVPVVLAGFGLFWIAWPMFGLRGSHGTERIEFMQRRYEARRNNFSALVALVAYYGPGLWITVSLYGGGAVGGYLRAHLLDGFGCAAFYAVGWRQLDLNARRALVWFNLATGGIAAASAYIAGGNTHVVIVTGLVVFVLANLMWGIITRFSEKAELQVKICLAEAAEAESAAGPD
jgi:hypothetical protein